MAILSAVAIVSFGGSPAQAERPALFGELQVSGGTGPTWTNSNCNGCHTPSSTFSHPVNVIPEGKVPDSLPLQHGKMTCVTCHDDSSSQLHAEARRTGDPMLRGRFSGPAMCAQCHDRSFTDASDAHAFAAGKAHFVWRSERLRTPPKPLARPRIDAESITCMECHDGSMATQVGFHAGGGDLFQFGSNQEHPIGVAYHPGTGRNRIPLEPWQTLDSRVRLFDGTVGCGSCHSVYSQQRNLLVMSNQKSALCLSCHDY